MLTARLAPLAALALSLPALIVRAEPPPEQALGEAATLASVCTGCHGGGESSTAIPSLRGRSAEALAASFLRYKNEAEGPSSMHRMARGYTDVQIQSISAYLAEQ